MAFRWAESAMPDPIAILGLGSIGMRHLRFLLDLSHPVVDFVCGSILAHESEGQQRKDSQP